MPVGSFLFSCSLEVRYSFGFCWVALSQCVHTVTLSLLSLERMKWEREKWNFHLCFCGVDPPRNIGRFWHTAKCLRGFFIGCSAAGLYYYSTNIYIRLWMRIHIYIKYMKVEFGNGNGRNNKRYERCYVFFFFLRDIDEHLVVFLFFTNSHSTLFSLFYTQWFSLEFDPQSVIPAVCERRHAPWLWKACRWIPRACLVFTKVRGARNRQRYVCVSTYQGRNDARARQSEMKRARDDGRRHEQSSEHLRKKQRGEEEKKRRGLGETRRRRRRRQYENKMGCGNRVRLPATLPRSHINPMNPYGRKNELCFIQLFRTSNIFFITELDAHAFCWYIFVHHIDTFPH